MIRLELLRTKLQELISSEAEVVTTEEQIHAAHILIGSEEGTLEEAQQVLERLKAGEDFAAVAAEVSDDTSNAQSGGDLQWFGRSNMIEPFANAAFALTEPDQLSDIVETQFGWHIIKLIEGPEERPLPETAIQQARDNAFTEFLSNLKTTEAAVTRQWTVDDMPSDPFIDEIREPLPTVPVPPTATVDPAAPTTAPEATAPAEATEGTDE
ncbi:MAG: peptidylprolyl isomerase [Ardenticatenales bacterium]|nr:peptidylprolyl isomerase [Ardenticatenales bacterium]